MIKTYCIENFLLQPIDESDRDFYVQLHSDAFIMKNIAPPLSVEKASKSFDVCLTHNLSKKNERYTWVINDKASSKKAGICALVLKDKMLKGSSFGIILSSEFQGQGHAKKILAGIMEYGVREENIERYVGYSIPGNEVSFRLMISLGYEFIKEEIGLKRPNGYYWFKNLK